MKNRKGQVTIYLSFIIFAIIIVILTAVLAPMGVQFGTHFYNAGETILAASNATLAKATPDEITAEMNNAIQEARGAQADNVEMNADLYHYSWVLVVVLVGIMLFLITRSAVEYTGGRGFV